MRTTKRIDVSVRWMPLAVGLMACCLVVASTGCNQGPAKPDDLPELTACTITVNYKGAPVEGASVLLSPSSGNKFSAIGTTDASGKAVLKTDGKFEGVAAGEYRATVKKMEKVNVDLGGTPETPEEMAEYQKKVAAVEAPKSLIPEKYSSFTSSGLTVTVAAGTPIDETFDLTD